MLRLSWIKELDVSRQTTRHKSHSVSVQNGSSGYVFSYHYHNVPLLIGRNQRVCVSHPRGGCSISAAKPVKVNVWP